MHGWRRQRQTQSRQECLNEDVFFFVFFRPNESELSMEASDCRHRVNLNTMELEMLVGEANARQARNKKRSPQRKRRTVA